MKYNFFTVDTIQCSVTKDVQVDVLRVTIDNPPVNALSSGILKELDVLLDELIKQKVQAFIFTGKGRAFIAGADIKEMQNFGVEEARLFAMEGHKVFKKLENMDSISVAMLNGVTMGGGLELTLACDIRIASENVLMGLPEVTLGLIPGFGGTQRLTRLIGTSLAKYHILTGTPIDLQKALENNLVHRIVTEEHLEEETCKIIVKLLRNGPTGILHAKHLINSYNSETLQSGLHQEVDLFASLFKGTEPSIGLRAFLAKEIPQYETD